jgi:uncharacterized protein YkwD
MSAAVVRAAGALALLLAATPTAAAPPDGPRVEAVEQAVVTRVNALRAQHRRPPLRVDADLARVARLYSCGLLERAGLSHTGATGDTVADRVRAAGKTFRAAGENLASNTNAPAPVDAAIAGWMKSPGHRENMLRADFTETGVGVCRQGATYYFTQLFLRPG